MRNILGTEAELRLLPGGGRIILNLGGGREGDGEREKGERKGRERE